MVGCIDDPVVLNRKIRGRVTDAHLIDDDMLDVIETITKFQSAGVDKVDGSDDASLGSPTAYASSSSSAFASFRIGASKPSVNQP
jgi:hypothetical protein